MIRAIPLLILSWATSSARAADLAVEVQRARLALAEDRVADALTLAASAGDEPGARATRLEASMAGGLGAWVQGVPEIVEPWSDAAHALSMALQSGDDVGAATAAAVLRDAYPDRPDLLTPLFDVRDPGRKVAKARAKLLRELASRVRGGEAPVAELYRIRSVLLAAGEDAELVVAALVAAGEPSMADGPGLTRFQLLEEARRQVDAGAVDVPAHEAPDALQVLAEQVAADALQAGRGELAVACWVAVRQRADRAVAALGHARALLALDRPEEALEVLDQAFVLAVDPDPSDLGVVADDRRRTLLAALLLESARAFAAGSRFPEAAIDLATAELLAGEHLDPALRERLALLVPRSTGPAPDALLAKAAASKDPEAAEAALASALLGVATSGGPQVWRREASEAHHLLGLAQEGAPARISLTLASLIADLPSGRTLTALASAREAAGQREATFRACAQLSVVAPSPEVEACLERTWTGMGERDEAVAALASELRARVAEAAAQPPSAAHPQPRVPANDAPSGPRFERAAPSWSFTDESGTVSSELVRGRTVALVFLRSGCSDCLALLYDFGLVARSIRREGRDVVVIGVAIDGDDQVSAFDHLRRTTASWAQIYRSPETAARWGVGSVPVAYLIDHEGVLRTDVTRWLGRAHIERQIRRTFAE